MRLFTLVLVALLFCCAGLFAAPPQFAVENKTAKFKVSNKVHVPPCGCGCMETGQCHCKNCCERTADPNWKPADSVLSKSLSAPHPANSYTGLLRHVSGGGAGVVYVGVPQTVWHPGIWSQVDSLPGFPPGVYDCWWDGTKAVMKLQTVSGVAAKVPFGQGRSTTRVITVQSAAGPSSSRADADPFPGLTHTLVQQGMFGGTSGGCANGQCSQPQQTRRGGLFGWK